MFLYINSCNDVTGILSFISMNYLGSISISTACIGWNGYGVAAEDGLATR